MPFASETWRRSECFVGNVVDNVGTLYGIEWDERSGNLDVINHGVRTWDYTPDRFKFLGHCFDQDGFWLATPDSSKQYWWYVGIVRENVGTLFKISQWEVVNLGNATWDAGDGKFLGRLFDVNGFWVRRSQVVAERPATPP